jgi:hypothetical protein
MVAWPSLIGIGIKGLVEQVARMHRLGERRVDLKASIIIQLREGVPVL